MRGSLLKDSLWFVVFITALTACGSGSTGKTVTNKDLGFRITFPEKWLVSEKTTKEPAVECESRLAAKAKDVAQVTVDVPDLSDDATLLSFVDGQTAGMDKRHKNFELIEKVQVNVGGATAYKVTYLYDSENTDARFRYSVYYLMAGKRGYQIETSATKEDFALYSAEFDNIVGSFKILPAQ